MVCEWLSACCFLLLLLLSAHFFFTPMWWTSFLTRWLHTLLPFHVVGRIKGTPLKQFHGLLTYSYYRLVPSLLPQSQSHLTIKTSRWSSLSNGIFFFCLFVGWVVADCDNWRSAHSPNQKTISDSCVYLINRNWDVSHSICGERERERERKKNKR
jgi:hypothetical protein